MTQPELIEDYITRCAIGERSAFEALYHATAPRLFAMTLRLLNDRAEAEDAIQEIYVKIWNYADRYKINGLAPMTWLLTITRNHAIDRLRARRGDTGGGQDEIVELSAIAVPDDDTPPAKILTSLPLLDPEQAEAIRRIYLDGDTYTDLVQATGAPINSVRAEMRRSLSYLADAIHP